MKQTVAIRRFPSKDEARDVALMLEAKGIACRVVTEPIFATLFVSPADSEAASEIIGDEGFDIIPLPDAAAGETVEDSDVSTKNLLPQVSAELDAIKKERTPWQNLGALVLSLILFVSLGLFRNSLSGIGILVGVIFLHECGHLIGMKLLKYKNVQMFFIPMLGAAVSGTETAPSGVRKAMVSLFGPVPGIIIGVVTGIAYLKTRQPILADATRMLLFLNTFNLLPIYPLDGGRFFDAIVFSRHPRIEIGFKIITTLILGWLAVTFKDLVFGVFAFLVFVSLRGIHVSARIAHAIRKEMDDTEDCASRKVPSRYVQKIVGILKERLPVERWKPKLFAWYVTEIWQRVCNKPCSIGPAVGLFLCYVFFILLGVGSGVMFETMADRRSKIVTRTLPNGDSVRVHIVSYRGHKLSETQVNDEGFFDGNAIAWQMFTTNRIKEGHWRDGFWHGEWKFWNKKGELTEIVEYDMGTPIRYRQLINGEMRDVPREDWPRYITLIRQTNHRGRKAMPDK